jgi:predicted permease
MNSGPNTLPLLPRKILKAVVPRRDGDPVQEIFSRLYQGILESRGRMRADFWLWSEILISLPGFVHFSLYWRLTMLRNYWLMAWRNIRKRKGHSLINTFGLSLGLGLALLIFIWVQDEIRYDRFHYKRDRIAQVYSQKIYSSGQQRILTASYYPLARILEQESPDVATAVRMAFNSGIPIQKEDQVFYNDRICLADPGFFDVFSFSLASGSSDAVFEDIHSIVLTEKMARKYFGKQDPIGQTLTVNSAVDLKITGVLHDLPVRSSLRFDCLIPFVWMFDGGKEPEHWGGNPLQTWVLVHPQTDHDAAARRITEIVAKHHPVEGTEETFHLHSLTRTHLYSPEGSGLNLTLTIFSLIAFLVLFIACINYMNLSTAQFATRWGEVGVRKVLGAKRSELIRQFMGESLLMTFIALWLALLLIGLVLPVFNHLLDRQLSLSLLREPQVLMGCLGIALLTGLFAGSYPAIYLSGMRPVNVFRRRIGGAGSASFRKSLVIVQFALSIALFICTVVIFRQLSYFQTKDLGFNRENLVTLQIGDELQSQYGSLKARLLQNPDILAVSRALQHPVNIASTVSAVDWDGRNPDEKIAFNWDYVHFDYFKTLELEILQGRAFLLDYPTDLEGAYIINRTAAALMGMDDPVGCRLSVFRKEGQIIGVVKDFHFQPLYHDIKPFVFMLRPDLGGNVFLRVRPESLAGVRDFVSGVINDLSPHHPANLRFFNDILMEYIYTAEQRMRTAAVYFTALAVLISCLGLFGLAAFMAEQRTKEIGIRKIMGASAARLVVMLSGDFTKWVLIANAFAWPTAYFISMQLLSRYAFRVRVGLEIFVLCGLAALFIALVTVSYQSLRAASADPVRSLRYE